MTTDLTVAYSVRSGTVTAFDDHVGSGEVTDDAGRIWPFHCTAIADGTRTITPGVAVVFEVGPGPLGLEAGNLRGS